MSDPRPSVRKHAVLILLFALVSPAMWAKGDKFAPDFAIEKGNDPVNVIVQFKHALRQRDRDKFRSRGGVLHFDLPLVRAVSGELPKNRLRELANDPDVAYVSPDRPLHAHLNNSAAAVNAPVAWSQGLDGTGITVAVIDSGIHDVDDLKDANGHSRVLYSEDFIGGGTDDRYGHGTHVSGILGGTGEDSTCDKCTVTYRGIAPGISFVNLRALDRA